MGMRCAAACPLACLRVSLRVRTGGDPVRIQSQPRAGEGVSSRRGGAPFPTCILAALRPVLFAAAACERVRWRRRAGGRLGLPAALGVSRERRYCPPAPPSPLCSSGRLVCRDLAEAPPLCRCRYLLAVRQQPVRQVLRVTCGRHTSLDHSITPLASRRTAGDAFLEKE